MNRIAMRVSALFSTVVMACPMTDAQDYSAVKLLLGNVVRSELNQKRIPAAYIVLVDDQRVIWNAAFGFADEQRKIPASPADVHRIASVSKLFTDIAVLQLVERGEIDIDAPISRYLPDFQPGNPFGKPITLRQIMSHRAGLVREPPVGHYMDPTEPSLARTVASLNYTRLVYEPEARYKYSNAGIAVAGYVLESLRKKPFAEYVDEAVLKPMGLLESSFSPRPDLMKRKPRAVLWTLDGRRMDVPDFQFGMSPAANMYSTPGDLARFMTVLFKKGEIPGGMILREETLEEMWRPQFGPAGRKAGVGLGFFVSTLEGNRRIGHSGDVYGFATEFAALPDQKLGVVVVNTMNACNDWSDRIASYALRLMLAQKHGMPLPPFSTTTPVNPSTASRIVGLYKKGDVVIEFFRRDSVLMVQGPTTQAEVRQRGEVLIVDDRYTSGTTIIPLGDHVVLGVDTLTRIPPMVRPAAVSERWKGLIGEYGWDHNTLYIHERHGVLYALIEWYNSYPLSEVLPDVFAFPDYGLYHGEQLIFRRDDTGKATEVTAASIRFVRRNLGVEEGKTFQIIPQRPVKELRIEAMRASPPQETGDFRKSDLVELQKLDPSIKLDIRYATENNFMGAVFYSEPRAFLQRPAAEAIARASQWLKPFGYGLLVYDAYRPWYVTRMFWDATPIHQRDFVADPSKGSRHNRGCAVDIGLYDLKTGQPAPMVSGYDEFSVRAYPDYPGEGSLQRWNREILRQAMEAVGFRVYEYEWWHFDFTGWERFPIMNRSFEDIH